MISKIFASIVALLFIVGLTVAFILYSRSETIKEFEKTKKELEDLKKVNANLVEYNKTLISELKK